MNPIIVASRIGPAATDDGSPAMPDSPEEITEATEGAHGAGVAVFRVHLRDNESNARLVEQLKLTPELVR